MSNSNWWANKLGQPTSKPSAPQYVAPQPATYVQPQTTSYPPSQQATPQAARCPGCGSGNYGGATPESRPRCYDCGYPIQQSGSGAGTGIVGGSKASGPATPAKQVEAGGWNPQTIIGHI
jgi:hypothetical protein